MPRPGWDVISRDAPVPPRVPTDTGVWFAAGGTEKGPLAGPVLVRSLGAYETTFGIRSGGPALYDAVDVFFREGGDKAYISCVPTTPSLFEADVEMTQAPSDATRAAKEAAKEAAEERKEELGELTVSELQEELRDRDLPTSGTKDELVARLAEANGESVPTEAEGDVSPLVVTPASIVAAIDKFGVGLGPGQVSAPGQTDSTVNAALIGHTLTRNRVALLEAPAAQTAAQLVSYAATLRTQNGARNSALFAPMALVPGIAGGTTRSVAWSSVMAGIISRNDARGLSVNKPSAGVDGESVFALDVDTRYTDTEYGTLNTGSVDMAQYRWGALEMFGYRSLADPTTKPDWWDFGNARLNMAIVADAGAVAERYVFSMLDGRGKTIAQFGGELRAMLVPYYEEGALYGNTAEDAFQVNVGPAVNTPDTIAAGELHAILMVRMSPFAEYVVIEVVKVATTQAIAA